MKTIALFGARGFVGSEILKTLQARPEYSVSAVSRENFGDSLGKNYDYVINAAMPSARFKAKNDPLWDFRESVEKTAKIYHGVTFKKFIQISSISARCQPETVYGRNKLAAESVIDNNKHLIVRLGPMYAPTLSKGVLVDMLNGSRIFAGAESRYAFSPLSFVGKWIADNLDRCGIVEVGAKNSITLRWLAEKLDKSVQFEGKDDHQEIQSPEKDFPDAELVLEFMKDNFYKGTR